MKYNKPPYPSIYWNLQLRQFGKFFFIFPAYIVTLIACFYSESKMNQVLATGVNGNASGRPGSNLLILESVNIAVEYEPDVLKPFIASILFGWTFLMTYIYMLYQFIPLIYYTVCLLQAENKWTRRMRVFLEDLQENAYEERRMLTEKEQKKIERFEKRPRMFAFGLLCQCCFYVWLFALICDIVDVKFIRFDGPRLKVNPDPIAQTLHGLNNTWRQVNLSTKILFGYATVVLYCMFQIINCFEHCGWICCHVFCRFFNSVFTGHKVSPQNDIQMV